MSQLSLFIISLFVYVLCAKGSLSLSNNKLRLTLFSVVNIAAVVWLSLLSRPNGRDSILSMGGDAVTRHIFIIGIYVFVVAVGFLLLKLLVSRNGWLPWVAFFYPLSILIIFKYFYFLWDPLFGLLDWDSWIIAATIIGLSYMAFRLSYLVLEVRNGTAKMPVLSEYLGFAFFLPTMIVGPINPFSNHQQSLEEQREVVVDLKRCLFRILIGATKYLYLGNLANQLSYNGLFLDGKPHGIIDLVIAAVFYYLFLYLNFSGVCDIAIGIAGLLGIRVKENFNNPFVAKNIKEFWNRWHITLSEYMRDVVFAPLSKFLIRKLGVKYMNFSIAVSIVVVFLLIGIWHGVGIHYAIFGLIHAVGVASNHYYTVFLKKKLGKERYRRYNENPFINATAMVLTFLYVAGSLAVFANNYNMMGVIKKALYAGI